MKLIFGRKSIVYYFVYLFIFLFVEYLFLQLFVPQCKDFSQNALDEQKFIKTENDRIVDEYKSRIVKLENELKKNKEDCERNNNRLNKLSRFDESTASDAMQQCEGEDVGDTFIRDFYHYKCKSVVRYPGDGDITNRIDGAYYACEDGNLKLKHSDCIVLSFGIYNNDMFDESVNHKKNCIVHSMDPFNEPSRVTELRTLNPSKAKAVKIEINEKWTFHSLGITNEERIRDVNKTGWLDTYEHILNYLDLNGKVIDIFKIDTEGAEWESIPYIMSTKPELLCKYVKQIAIETHSWLYTHESNYKVLKSLEVCFRLYRRDQRFYLNGEKTEWDEDDFKLSLSSFINEVDLARFLFTYGELYFINKRFL